MASTLLRVRLIWTLCVQPWGRPGGVLTQERRYDHQYFTGDLWYAETFTVDQVLPHVQRRIVGTESVENSGIRA